MALHEFFTTGAAIFFAIISGVIGGSDTIALPENKPVLPPTITIVGGSSFTPLPPLFTTNGNASSTLPAFPSFLPEPTSTPVPNSTPVTPRVVVDPKPEKEPEEEPASTSPANLADVLVNIVCTSKDRSIRSISGSGAVVDPRGIVLTAAHVAQFTLVRDYPASNNVQCTIRTGNPARPTYVAVPLYISETWIEENSNVITETSSMGNGANDFAFLAIRASATGLPLPKNFPHVPLGNSSGTKGDTVTLGSYGAEFITSEALRNSLYQTVVSSTVQKTYTLDTTSVDLYSLGASAAAQSGSSGGTVVKKGNVIGVITTSSLGSDLSKRDLRAISIGHIRASYAKDRKTSLDADLKGSIDSLLTRFENTALELSQVLISELKAN